MLLAALATTALLAPALAPNTSSERACGRTAQSLTTRWIDAFNNGDAHRLDDVFAPASIFEWYSSSPPAARLRADAKDRTTLLAYLTARHQAGERLRVRRWQFNSVTRRRFGNFEFTLRRRLPMYRGGGWFTVEGKGALRCDHRKIIVISLGAPRRDG
jgi:hypothetical protein